MSSYLRGRSGSLSGSGSTTPSTANGLCDNPTRGRCGLVLCISSVDDMTSSHRVPHRTHRRRRWSAAVLLVSVAAFATLPITPAGHAAAQSAVASTSNTDTSDHTATTEDPAAAAVVRHLLDGDGVGALAALPPGFAPTMGYRPVLDDGKASNPHGGCSSPVPMPSSFEPLCRTHDFGYDLLRYSARVGHPLGAWARLGLDTSLVTRMRETCHDPLCWSAAELARVGLGLNTWHEGEGPPQDRNNLLTATFSAIGHLVHGDIHGDPDRNSDAERDGAQAPSGATR